ncbi:hypothetical protein L861_13940 [Litchfieldella anticariensis FP35 = DSM 16096]|uniref:DUF2971 domain-containing protein n=1 Tax=Litchfieldella anticariensis (strain DSM 16096 / CECT 5854 / CIP 108499 / LMG 22089 / FP35) TaxID=1121939 RepID=S2KES9_LITA3|nr:DUF2971 domain-containing protein [Halomonas anticariensis]EPC00370.1 hypothetical protein L861_13940 [Halomonas anticariensis FP35 = DSM 16096]
MQCDTLPDRLYKYRSFGNLTIDMLVSDKLYFADPSTFNDPFDSKPCVNADISIQKLEGILRQLVEHRTKERMTAAAKSIKYRGPKTIEHITKHSRLEAERLINNIRYLATDPDYLIDDPELYLLTLSVEDELLRQFNRGIVSLAERSDCPLMWSHYGDQHKGICVGYSIQPDTSDQVHKVEYGGSRLIEASTISAMLDDDYKARAYVDKAALLRKSPEWNYEREWRLIGTQGLQDSPLELEEVIFGMRCEPTIMYSVIKMLSGRQKDVHFYEMRPKRGSFEIIKCEIDADELLVHYPRRARTILEEFSSVK